jgi:hypothetical protein
MAGSVNQLQAVVRILDGVLGVIAASQSGASGSGRRLLQQTQQLDLNGLNSELFASLNSLALDISSQLMTVEGDSLPVSAQRLSGIVRRGVVGNDSLTLSVAGSSLSVPAVAVSQAAGTVYDVALFVTPAADFEYLAQTGQVSDVVFVAAYAAASYSSPLAPHTATSALISSLLPSNSNYSVTLDVAFDPALAGSCLNTVDPVTGLVCSLQCRQWNGTDFIAAGVQTDFLALNNATHTARCLLSQPGVLSLFTASESSSVLLASSSSGSYSSSGAAGDQAGAVRASVTFPAPFAIVNMKDFKQGLVQDLAFVTGEPAARFNVEQVTTNAANGLTTVIIDIWVPLARSEASSQSVYEQLAALSLSDVLSTSYLRYADLSSWLEQCSDLVFRPTCSASSSSSAAWMLPLIIAASAAGFLLCCALTVLAVRRYYAAPAKDDKTVDDFTLPGAAGVAKQYIYSPPTAGKELDAEISRSEVSDVTIVASNIDPHTAGSLHTGDEEISEPVIVESEAEAAELAKLSDSQQTSQRSAVDSIQEDDEKELSVSAAGQSRHFYYVDDSVQRSELSRTDSASAGSASSSGRQQRLSVSQAQAAPASKSSSHFRIGHMGAAAEGRREPSVSGASASVSSRGSAAGSQSMHFRYSDNEDSKSTSRTPSLPNLSHSPSHSAVSQQQTQDAEAFHTFSHLDLNAAADADAANAASSAAASRSPAAAADKKPIKVIRPGAH